MKKGLLVLGAAAMMMLAMTSCNKETTCKCDLKYSTTDPTLESLLPADATSEATVKGKVKCADEDYTTTAGGITTTFSCKEK